MLIYHPIFCSDDDIQMDIGVGSFVFSLGLTSAAPFLRADSPTTTVLSTVLSGLRKSIPVWILGVVRVLMVKGVEYPVSYSS
jgi:phosphatidylinositol glycan class W